MYGLLDIHSHILPGVDDGARDLDETRAMLLAAGRAGVTSVIATPHKNGRSAGASAVRDAYKRAKPLFYASGMELRLGFECLYSALDGERDVRRYAIEGTNVLLLEFNTGYLPQQWENAVYSLQGEGLDIVIAHPERYLPVQRDIGIAKRMVEIGCELQLSGESLCGGAFSKTARCAYAMLKEGLAGYIASDAHCAADYRTFSQAVKKHGAQLRADALLKATEREA